MMTNDEEQQTELSNGYELPENSRVLCGTKELIVDFNKIFDLDSGLEEFQELALKKRSYYTIVDLIAKTTNRIFDDCQENIIMEYLNVVSKMKDTDKEYSIDDFTFDILNNILNQSVINSINDFIDRNYTGKMDEKTEETKKQKNINVELQFTDEHVSMLLKIAEAVRLCIPLITEYYNNRPENKELNDLLYDLFIDIIKIFQGKINLINKLHRFIQSRVIKTQYSDKTIWNLLSNKSKDVFVITIEFLQEIIMTIIPKSIMEKDIVNLFHVVVKRKTTFEFCKDYKMTFKPVNLNQADSDGLTQFDKWEITLTKRNESKVIINKLSIKYELNNIKRKFGFKITQREFEYYKEHIQINQFQQNFLFLFYSKYIGSYDSMYNCSRDEYIYLLILMYKWMIRKGYKILPKYIMGIPDRLSEKRISNKSNKIFDKVVNSQIYKQLLDGKYLFIDENIIKSNHIIKLIGNLTVSKYIELMDYNKYSSENLDNYLGNEIEDKVEIIADDILNFLVEI